MPVKAGTSQKTFVDNIREIMHSFHRSGSIGNSTPRSAGKAVKQTVAIAYRKKHETIARRRSG